MRSSNRARLNRRFYDDLANYSPNRRFRSIGGLLIPQSVASSIIHDLIQRRRFGGRAGSAMCLSARSLQSWSGAFTARWHGTDLVTGSKIELHLTVAQLLTSLVVGLSGGKILTLMAEKQAATISKDQLAATLKRVNERLI